MIIFLCQLKGVQQGGRKPFPVTCHCILYLANKFRSLCVKYATTVYGNNFLTNERSHYTLNLLSHYLVKYWAPF